MKVVDRSEVVRGDYCKVELFDGSIRKGPAYGGLVVPGVLMVRGVNILDPEVVKTVWKFGPVEGGNALRRDAQKKRKVF